ncbi:hypothetical protein B879_03834 [Cecembia lonarensis LW9]|uniref:Uncharacterized protein n=1 Tax=Cecembia lonarensis (strain CCUG 58316 / KCTC 22772 / LW9) TaxID=1225176 RepID=K1KYI3_CECL9|nr:hypothetical protein B879_03834 [Cecembia lonarensis LW9]
MGIGGNLRGISKRGKKSLLKRAKELGKRHKGKGKRELSFVLPQIALTVWFIF